MGPLPGSAAGAIPGTGDRCGDEGSAGRGRGGGPLAPGPCVSISLSVGELRCSRDGYRFGGALLPECQGRGGGGSTPDIPSGVLHLSARVWGVPEEARSAKRIHGWNIRTTWHCRRTATASRRGGAPKASLFVRPWRLL